MHSTILDPNLVFLGSGTGTFARHPIFWDNDKKEAFHATTQME